MGSGNQRYFNKALRAVSVGLLGVLAASCATTTASSTTTTGLGQATFAKEKLWNTLGFGGTYASTVFITPYWAAFYTTNGGDKWKLHMPANVSPRRGITMTLTPALDEAVGFFAYGAQKNSVIFVFGPGHVSAPIFLPGPLAQVRQAVALKGAQLFALGNSGNQVTLQSADPASPSWTTLETGSAGGVSAVGFDAGGNDGIALLGSSATNGFLSNVYVSANGGTSWQPASLEAPPSGTRITDVYVPEGFGANSYEVALSLKSGSGYETDVITPNGSSLTAKTTNPQVVGSDPQGDLYSVSGLLGQAPELEVFNSSSGHWSAPFSMTGVAGDVQSVGFSSKSDGVVIADKSNKLVTYKTSDGGHTWTAGGSIVAVPSA